MSGFNLSSPVFEPNQPIPQKYSCVGQSINPPLNIQNPPAETKSFTLIVEDPDAPNGGFTHWVLFNISPEQLTIDEHSAPGVEGQNGAGSIGYVGPCPPSGTHHYHFKLFALNITLPLKAGATKSEVENSQKNHILAQTSLIGLFSKG